MGASFVPIFFISSLWGAVGIVLPLYIPKGPNHGLLKLVLRLTGGSCWIFWLCCYMAQMNPLIGPRLHNSTVLLMARAWNDV